MIALSFTGRDFALGRNELDVHPRIHLTSIETDGTKDTYGLPEDDVVITVESTRTPHDQQWVKRPVVLGSRMVLVAPMHYSTSLTSAVIDACRTIDAVEKEELPGDDSCPFYEGVAIRLVEQFAPAKRLRALKDDFGYILAYMPPYQTSYRTVRSADPKSNEALNEAAHWVKRPVYMLRENAYLTDSRRRLAEIPRTLDGRVLVLAEYGQWNDHTKSI